MELLNILRKQAEVFRNILNDKLAKAKTEAEVYSAHSTVFKEFYSHAFKPLSDGKSIKDLNSEVMNDLMTRNSTDIGISFDQLNSISSRISGSYNANQDYKTSLKNRIEQLGSMVSSANIILNDSNENSIVFKDSLSNHDFIDKEFSGGTLANIATSEGIACLAILNDKNLTQTAKDIKISGNGEAGNKHVIKKVNIITFNEDYNVYSQFKSDQEAHDDPLSIIDNEPATWFEYQKLGVDRADKERYYIDWQPADRIKDELSLRINIELANVEDINWIDITPYIPEKSKSNIILYSAKVSEDGSNYTSIYKNSDIIEREINIMPQRYYKDNLFRDDNITKLAAQGILSFPTVRAKFVEIILKQTKPYNELIGATYYEKSTIINGEEISRYSISPNMVPPEIVEGPIGKYKIEKNDFITKNIAVLNGWRYVIGVRGIDIYNRTFHEQSEIITKKFTTEKPIKEVMLYANEIIPDAFLSYGLEKRNDWIKYYISINDSDWYQISPMDHNQVGDLKIAPKIYEINSIASNEERIASMNRGYLTSEEPVKAIRLKIIFSRPTGLNTFTPILEEYALRCILDGGV